MTDPDLRSHLSSAPVGPRPGRRFERLDDDRLDILVAYLSGRPDARLVEEAVDPMLDEPLAPLANRLVGRSTTARDVRARTPVSASQHQLRSERDAPIHSRSLGEAYEFLTLLG
jgi:hypothetical protein